MYKYKTIITYVVLFVCCSCSFQKHHCWIDTVNGVRLWICQNDTSLLYRYVWVGGTFDQVAHGDGILFRYRDDILVDSIIMHTWYGSTSSDQIKTAKDGAVYIGEYTNKRHGFGVLVYKENIYCGHFKEGFINGQARKYHHGELVYDGAWKKNMFNGVGTYFNEHGNVSRGVWQNNCLIEADTIFTTPIGIYYGRVTCEGIEGHGTMRFFDGSIYDGMWECNVPSGEGIAQYRDSSIYKGNWSMGNRHGYGECKFSNGDYYKGEWRKNEIEGYGTYFCSDGRYFVGNWKQGKPNGKGHYESTTIQKYDGSWENGIMVGDDTITYSNGDKYIGNVNNNQREGNGAYIYANGNIYEGQFSEDSFNGLGIFNFANGNRYEGEFAYGHFAGEGTLYYYDDHDTVIITSYWDGTDHFPHLASLLFTNGDLYEGEIINGTPTSNGQWITINFKDRSFIQKGNEYYIAHQQTISNIIKWTSYSMQIGTLAVGCVYPPVMPAVIKLIRIENKTFSIVQDGLETASSAIEFQDAIEMDYGIKETAESLVCSGAKLATNFIPGKNVNVAQIVDTKIAQKVATQLVIKNISEGELVSEITKLIQSKWITSSDESEIYKKLSHGESLRLFIHVRNYENRFVKRPQNCIYCKFD